MSDPSVNPLKRLIGEIHRRSLWQVLGIYVVASWAVLSVVDTVGGALNLPDWFPSFALALLIIGLPIVLATAFVQEGGQGQEALEPKAAPGDGAAPRPKIQIPSRLLTWRNALFGGVGALALWGVVAAGWLLFAGGLTATDDSATVVLSAVAEVDNAVDRGDWIEAFGLARALPPEIPDSIRATIPVVRFQGEDHIFRSGRHDRLMEAFCPSRLGVGISRHHTARMGLPEGSDCGTV